MNDQPKYYAFFDVDGTLVRGKTMLDFLRFYYCEQFKNIKIIGELKYVLFLLKAKIHILLGKKREFLNTYYYQCFKNKKVSEVLTLGKNWFESNLNNNNKAFIKEILNELIFHKNNGAEIVFVSGSFIACLEPLANKLGVKYVISTNLEKKDGIYTGNILDTQVIGEGKSINIRRFLKHKQFNNLKNCYAYGDHYSDLHMLSLVGNPRVVSGDIELERYARKNGWNIISV